MKPCKVEGCERRVRNQGLCSGHYRRGEKAEVAPRAASAVRDAAGRKRCCRCEEWLAPDQFTRDARTAGGLRSVCRKCHRSAQRERKFGVSSDWFDTTLAAQGDRCAICRSPEPRGRGWAIDHDHECCPGAKSCGACIRAILCSPCNLALGLFGDRVVVLRAAAEYVAQHSERMSAVRGV